MLNASIITIGDELLIGQTIDTNSAFIAQELNKIGVWVKRRVAVGDVYDDIWQALDEERKQVDIIIITGGLGPTADDITKPLLCRYFGGQLIVNEAVLAHVKYLFEKIYNRPGPILERNMKQAEVPDNCIVLPNALGTAPGMWFNADGKVFISLPGVPYEMKGLVTTEVLPRLQDAFTMPAIVHETVFTAGVGESAIAEILLHFETSLPEDIKLAYLPSYGMVKLRLTITGVNKLALQEKLQPYYVQLQELVAPFLVSAKDEGLEVVIGNLLKAAGKTMGTAESCTGGYIAHLITSIAGSSAYYKGGIVSYANEVKQNVLGVQAATLETAGAVSEDTVKQMVDGALKTLQVDYALAISGIMGPGGGSPEKPVGTVWIAAGNKDKVSVIKISLRFDRERNIHLAAMNALNFFRKFILTNS
jgi:nicotinamide-nucleotide amidase